MVGMRLCTALVFLVYITAQASAKKNSRFVWKRPAYAMPWLKGPNICAVEEVTGSRRRYYDECMTYMPRRICDKPTYIRYHCCTGYERVEEGARGCEGVVPVENLSDTIKHLYLLEYNKTLKRSGLESMYEDGGAFTVFAPDNRAFRTLPEERRQEILQKTEAEELVRRHTVKDRHWLRDLRNDIELPTLSEDHPAVKINRYSNGIVTVNCARIVIADQVAKNGIIHTTDRLVEPFQERGTVMETLLRDDTYQFGELVTALIVTQLGNRLRDETKTYTVFAPTDAAFRSAPEAIINKILGDKDLLERLLLYHILDQEICSAAILNRARIRTLEGQKVNLTCDVNDLMRVNDIPVSSGDIVATNGVIHVVDEILVPNAVKSLDDLLMELHLLEFMEYSQQAGLADELQGLTEGNYTVFVPSPEAFDSMSAEERHMLQTRPAAVRRVFQYHVIPGRITTNTIVDGSAVRATSGDSDTIVISVQQGGYSVNEARIINADHEAHNGVIHIIDRILKPPEETAINKIEESSELSTFHGLLQTANMDGMLLDAAANYSIFAPTNDAFDSLPREYLNQLMGDKKRLSMFIKYHLIPRCMYTSVQRPKLRYRYQTMTGDWVRMRTDEDDAGDVLTTLNDYVAISGDALVGTNGVIYPVNDVLHCPCLDGEGFDDTDDDSQESKPTKEESSLVPVKVVVDTSNVVEQLQKQQKQLSSFLEAIQETVLHNMLINFKGNLTVFAPTNEAFGDMNAEFLMSLFADPAELNKFLKYHILETPIYTDVMQPTFPYRYHTMADDWLNLYKADTKAGTITIDDRSDIIGGPYFSQNGVVYSIDTVLRCPCLSYDGQGKV